MNKKNQITTALTILIICCLIIAGLYSYFEYYLKEDKVDKDLEKKEYDDRVSPFINQGITVEILRIRHRGLLEEILKFGTSWKNKPNFYWKIYVDEQEADGGSLKTSSGKMGEGGFTGWDSILNEERVNFYIEEEQEKSDISISIIEKEKKGLFGRKTTVTVQENIDIIYDYRTGRWNGHDSLKDDDGYGHYVGEKFEIWFNIYQSDYDHDGIPYWIEVNVLETDPGIDDSTRDPDNDGIPTSWEWKWGYDPHVWDDHEYLDPDIDGIENIEEYQMRKWFANPYQPDIYLEADGMQKGGFLDWEHTLFDETQQILIERFSQHGINLYIDYGWPDSPVNGGGERLPFVDTLEDIIGGALRFYQHNFPDERKGIFRYLVIANYAGFCTPSKYNSYDTMVVDTPVKKTLFPRLGFTPKYRRVILAKGILHEFGHSFGLMPWTFNGVDIMPQNTRYPSMPEEEYQKYVDNYYSVMNYYYIFRFKYRDLIDYSDGSNGPPYDQNDWEHIYLPAFQIDDKAYEEPRDESFEDYEVFDKNPGVVLNKWDYDKNLTNQYKGKVSNFVFYDMVKSDIRVYVTNQKETETCRDVRIYAKPQMYPTHTVWSLIAEGKLDSKGDILFYSAEPIIEQVKDTISENS